MLSTLPVLPIATGVAYAADNVKAGFTYNGQIDETHNSVPCFQNLLHTFRGDVDGTCLDDRKKICETYFEEMYINGTISESTYNSMLVPKDLNSKSEVVEKSSSISLENCHRAKILSSDTQIRERRKLIDEKRMEEYNNQKKF